MDNMIPKISDALLEKPIRFTVEIRAKNKWHWFLQKITLKPRVEYLEIRPLTLGVLIEISAYLVEIDLPEKEFKEILKVSYDTISKYGEVVAKIIALAIHGRQSRTNPLPDSLVKTVMDNFSSKDIATALTAVFVQMNIGDFIHTIASIRNLNTIQASPLDQGRSIASGSLSAAS